MENTRTLEEKKKEGEETWCVDTARRSEGPKPQETTQSKQSQNREESDWELPGEAVEIGKASLVEYFCELPQKQEEVGRSGGVFKKRKF